MVAFQDERPSRSDTVDIIAAALRTKFGCHAEAVARTQIEAAEAASPDVWAAVLARLLL
jgi:hypothetical protein